MPWIPKTKWQSVQGAASLMLVEGSGSPLALAGFGVRPQFTMLAASAGTGIVMKKEERRRSKKRARVAVRIRFTCSAVIGTRKYHGSFLFYESIFPPEFSL